MLDDWESLLSTDRSDHSWAMLSVFPAFGMELAVMLSSHLYFLLLTAAFWVSSSSALHSGEEPYFRLHEIRTWANNDSITDTVSYEDGSSARLIFLTEGDDSISLPPFGCGFIRPPAPGGDATWFLGVLILQGPNTSVANRHVWLANRDRLIGENATLVMTAQGGLVLRDADGTEAWSSRTTGMSLLGIKLGDTGNLLLYNDSYTVWESFDEPGDTLLPGQMLYQGSRLVASASTQNWSSGGQCYVQMASGGFSAFVQADADAPLKYLHLGPGAKAGLSYPTRENPFDRSGFGLGKSYTRPCRPTNICRSRFGPSPTTYAIHNGETLVLFFGGTNYSYQISPESAVGSYPFLRLGFDGRLRTLRRQSGNLSAQMYDLVSGQVDNCQNPNVCGEYGICAGGGNCSCPKALINGSDYFRQIEGPSTGLGCSESYDSSISNGNCYLLYKILSIRENPIPGDGPYKSSAFIKVQLPYLALAPSPDPGNKTVSAGSPLQTPSQPGNNTALANSPIGAPNSQRNAPRKKTMVFFGIVMFLVVLYFVISKKNKKKKEDRTEGEEDFQEALKMPEGFTYEELSAATDDFKNQLGGGGFGTVYKGALKDGTKVAVKRLDNRGQGMKEFLAEVETIGNVNHFNLVHVIGFCADKSCQLLVYEYMSNGSLDKWIFNREKNMAIDWQTRMKIILDVARGLAYLHEECRQRIAHLDIKPHNILLDAKVSDFGLSKLMARDQSQVQTTMRGTPGYTLKNSSMVDIQLHKEEFMKMIKLAAWCLQDDHTRRPQMSMVVKVMEGAAEIEPNISYKFCHATAHSPTISGRSPAVADDSEPPQASVLSGPR
ncbi:hypothetical protein ACLOJK_010660 [Asimina triloba]